jgi:nucleoside-diphosphate-sugar epimerase
MSRVFVAGGAGLVGQNIIPRLIDRGFEVAAVDKNAANAGALAELNPKARVLVADMAEPGPWQAELAASDVLVMLQAQIGGLDPALFERNNITSTRRALEAAADGSCGYVVHVSSSVVNSAAVDLYTESKKAQEAMLADCETPHIVLRPTLMFGWFDRKHLGWLRRFMDRSPIFPIPGSGRWLRQPLYAGDFAAILTGAIGGRLTGAYNISGLQKIDYVDLIKAIKRATKSRSAIVFIPVPVFAALLSAYALFDRNPPFTVAQLKALLTPDVFEVIDWPGIFGVTATPLEQALAETFLDPRFGRVTLEF